MTESKNNQSILSKVIAKAWNDPEFKSVLLGDPVKVLTEMGISIPKDVNVRIVEDTDNLIHMILPLPPTEELTMDELNRLSGGISWPPRITMPIGDSDSI